jgi:hypothetical protein
VFWKAHRSVVSYLVAAVMLAGIFALPNAILCAAPNGHVAIEIVSGGDCSEVWSRVGERITSGPMDAPPIVTTRNLAIWSDATKRCNGRGVSKLKPMHPKDPVPGRPRSPSAAGSLPRAGAAGASPTPPARRTCCARCRTLRPRSRAADTAR